jgi:hypothetical protein
VIVYGDTEHETTIGEAAARLGRLARDARVAGAGGAGALDAYRRLLVAAGQLEQAVHDTTSDASHAARCTRLMTDACARVFCSEWFASQRISAATRAAGTPDVHGLDEVDALIVELASGSGSSDARLVARAPEGFALYTLYPDQYCAAALRWADAQRQTSGRVLVVGVRSIGTALSAVVAAALGGARSASRITVRPGGHPFDRHVHLDVAGVASIDDVIVVDEGPGLSGSSIAAAAEALARGGVAPDRISVLPGHPHGPGRAATERVRRWWSSARQYVVPVEELTWHGRTLTDELALATAVAVGGGARVVGVRDISAGEWRHVAYDDGSEWPAVCRPFERTKKLCQLDDGSRVVWKFVGWTDEVALVRVAARSAALRGPRPLASMHGFLAVEWIDGERLDAGGATRVLLDPDLLDAMASHIVACAGAPLGEDELVESLERLAHAAEINVGEALGTGAASRVVRLVQVARQTWREWPATTYGDGDMRLHEWVRDGNGRIWKVGGGAHDRDHTVVGSQSIAWDVAAVAVEWQLDMEARRTLVGTVEAAAGMRIAPACERFHLLAYAAFRLGQTVMSAESEHDERERERLAEAAHRYRTAIEGELATEPDCPAVG